MKIALIAFSDTQEFRVQIKDEMLKRGHKCDLLPFSVLPIRTNLLEDMSELLSGYDVVHFVLGFNEELTRELQNRLTKAGVICPNHRNLITHVNNKVAQAGYFAKGEVPTPKTYRLVQPKKEDVAKEIGFPFVLKEPEGSKGEKVTMCTDLNFDQVVKNGKEYLAQEFIDYAADYRVHVAGPKTFCIYERIAPVGDFRANVSLGGSMKAVVDQELLVRLSTLALKATKVLGMDYGGVDIVRDKNDQLLVLEFNPNPGFKNVTDITGTPFYKPIADYYESLVR